MGVLGANIELIVPSVQKQYSIRTAYTGNFTVTVKPVGDAGGIVLNTGQSMILYTNGTDIHEVVHKVDETQFLRVDQNLDDLDDVAAARANLGLTDANIISIVGNALMPVGTIYGNGTNTTNPATLLGFGTWAPFAEGRVIVGIGTGTDINSVAKTFALAATGGEYEHVQTLGQSPKHSHKMFANLNGPATLSGVPDATPAYQRILGANVDYQMTYGNPFDAPATLGKTSTVGNDEAMQWMQPYVVAPLWIRTA